MIRRFLVALAFFLSTFTLVSCSGGDGPDAGVAASGKSAQLKNTAKAAVGDSRGYALTAGIWPATPIGVCWEFDDSFMSRTEWQRGIVKKAVEDTWVANSNVSFTGWGKCSEYPNFYGIRIALTNGVPGYYYNNIGYENNNWANAMRLNFDPGSFMQDCYRDPERCIRITAVHEFGHGLGFSHEQNRPDKPENCADAPQGKDGDISFGDFDMESVMSYCNAPGVWMGDGILSATDIKMVQHFYGKKPRLMYVVKASQTPQWIAVFEMENATSVAQIPADPMVDDGVTRVITHIVSSPDDKFVFYVNQPWNRPGAHVHTIDTTTNKIIKSTAINEEIVDLKVSPDSKTLYVLWVNDQNQTGVRLFDASSNAVLGDIPLSNAKLLATPRVQNDAIYVLTATSDSSAQSIAKISVPDRKVIRTYAVGPAGKNGLNLGLSMDEKKIYFVAHEITGDSTPRMAALNLADGTYFKLPPLPAGLDVFDMQVLNMEDILIGTHIDSMGPRIYNIETGKVSVVHSGSNQDGPYLYVYSPDSGQNIYTMSDGRYGGNLNWFSRQQDLSYSGGDIHMYSFQMYSFAQKRPFTLVH
ncbi:hypothetical protein AWB68_03066 [Caballeronia choica]|uniref:Peptidase metallopeptidase domain-containing protein n=1 Tax=Caballeronia choica TaxID=326476 RepID=A0A158IUH8_9BURK|nr:hypothetical protein [Caballeronia choica]SAL60342.1 hypothetical protein AWB68_03066 [Caballeronia choica]